MRQRVIVYSLDGITEQIYCTAYSDQEAVDALVSCTLWLHDAGLLTRTSQPSIEDARTFYAYSY